MQGQPAYVPIMTNGDIHIIFHNVVVEEILKDAFVLMEAISLSKDRTCFINVHCIVLCDLIEP